MTKSSFEAVGRELAEEVGYKAGHLSRLYALIAPGSICYATDVVMATELIPGRQAGDEPEVVLISALQPFFPPEVV